jgi:hypothetical protein
MILDRYQPAFNFCLGLGLPGLLVSWSRAPGLLKVDGHLRIPPSSFP